ncbi:MAG: bifunctional riboflavin kinase/FAD synthetase [Oleispira sp.]|nr:bifunctional riboflavin kinase/FAD synthetase [Oleispira sp.]MBL4882373.1 bifunctional riboflavin kinase/FAD synthetase [Oleispira sp.]
MRLIRGLYNIPSDFSGCVATIGNFDGVHLGHQAILQQLKKQGEQHQLPTVVMMFEPQPREFFAPDQAPARLANMSEKLQDLASFGIDYILCLPFNQKLRSMSADQFIQTILLDGLQIRHLIIGDDFRFGCDRTGDYQLLQQAGNKAGFSVEDTKTFELDGERVSSTRVREYLSANDLAAANTLLGRPYRMSGRIGYGRQLGRTIGIPTANVILQRNKLPMTGVYAVKAIEITVDACHESQALDQAGNVKEWQGVANIGVKPTVAGTPEPSLEVHIFDFPSSAEQGELYGKRLTIEFCQKIREEKKFNGLDELKAAIANDMKVAREFFLSGLI